MEGSGSSWSSQWEQFIYRESELSPGSRTTSLWRTAGTLPTRDQDVPKFLEGARRTWSRGTHTYFERGAGRRWHGGRKGKGREEKKGRKRRGGERKEGKGSVAAAESSRSWKGGVGTYVHGAGTCMEAHTGGQMCIWRHAHMECTHHTCLHPDLSSFSLLTQTAWWFTASKQDGVKKEEGCGSADQLTNWSTKDVCVYVYVHVHTHAYVHVFAHACALCVCVCHCSDSSWSVSTCQVEAGRTENPAQCSHPRHWEFETKQNPVFVIGNSSPSFFLLPTTTK